MTIGQKEGIFGVPQNVLQFRTVDNATHSLCVAFPDLLLCQADKFIHHMCRALAVHNLE